MERLYTLEEAKKLLGVTTMTIQYWYRDGEIWVVRAIGGRRRIPERDKAHSGIEGGRGRPITLGFPLQRRRIIWRGRRS